MVDAARDEASIAQDVRREVDTLVGLRLVCGMKLVVAIVHPEDAGALVDALTTRSTA